MTALEARILLAGDAGAAVATASATAPQADVAPAGTDVTVAPKSGSEIAFVDPSVDNVDQLVDLVSENVEIVLVDGRTDVLDQMNELLRSKTNVRAIHIISHGAAGQLQFGSQLIDDATLQQRAQELQSWRGSLHANADILFYGCDAAAGDVGERFLKSWASLTGADVAGSVDRTGATDRGGNWVLESTLGTIETPLIAEVHRLETIAVTLPITIYAAGSTGDEQMELQIDGITVAAWSNVGGDAEARQFEAYTYNADGLSADQVSVLFTNDLWNPAEGIDRNLRIDRIEVDGEVFETEDPSVFGTGTWLPADGIQPGFRESEWLHSNGYFRYADTSPPGGGEDSTITIYAAGNENVETMELWLGGVRVETWNNIGGDANSRQFVSFQHTSSSAIAPEDVQIHFTNDAWDPVLGIDNNLRVDRIEIDGAIYETEDPSVYSTGTWKDGEITPGFKEDETLHTNGFFQFASISNPGVIALATNSVTVNEDTGTVEIDVLRTSGSDGLVTVDYDTELGSATPDEDYTPVSGTLTFDDGETSKTISIPILDDSLVESIETFGITIDNVNGGAVLLVPRTAIVTIIDDEVSLPNYPDFTSVAGLTLNGDATQTGNNLQLTSETDDQVGSAFYDQVISLSDGASFRSAFSFQISGGTTGTDGLTFTIQNDALGSAAIGSGAGGLGFEGIDNALAIEFDTFQNPGDANDNHISIDLGSVGTSLRTIDPDFDLNNGTTYFAWVDYNGGSDMLAVYLSDSAIKPTTALLKATVDLETEVGDSAFFGFTAASSVNGNAHEILSWQVDQQIPPQDPPTAEGDTVVSVNVVEQGLFLPTAIEWLPDGTMLIAEKGGVVKTASAGVVSSTPFIDISDIVNGVRDRGLLDIAVHPDFVNNPYVYLLFTYDPPEVFQQAAGTLAGPDGIGNRAGRLIRVTADVTNNYLTAVEGSEVVLLGSNSTWENFDAFTNSTNDLDAPPAGENPDGSYLQDFINSDSESHTVGGLAFAPDGALMVSIGDGASYNDVDVRADRVQHIDSLSGKILRIDPITGQGLSDNPFFNGDADANRSKVYQLGLRNPFRISVDSETGQLFVGDVGWTQWEEINASGPGANFGWPFYEGGNGTSLLNNSYANTPEGDAFFNDPNSIPVQASLYALNHQADGINAIVMGDVYRGTYYPSQYFGDVFFNDLGQGIVRNISFDSEGNITDVSTFTTGANVVVAMSQGPDGAMYFVDLDDMLIGRWEVI